MNNFLSLLKVQFLSFFSINKLLKNKNKKVVVLSLLGIALGAVGFIFGLGYVYSMAFFMAGGTNDFLPSMLALIVVVCLIFSYATTGLGLYAYKDYELLASMPVKTHVVVLSKLAVTYLLDLIFTVIFLASSVLCLFLNGASVSSTYLALLFLMSIFTPAFSMIISIVLGFIISLISSRFNKRAFAQTAIMLIFAVVVIAISFLKPDEMLDSLNLANKVFFLSPLVLKGVEDVRYALLFILIMGIAFAITTTIICLTYGKMYALIKAYKKNGNFRLGSYSGQSQFKVLVKKEIKTLFSFSIYAANTLMGTIMAIILSVAIIIIPHTELGVELLKVVPQDQLATLLIVAVNLASAFAFSLSPTTAVSLAVEGKQFFLMKTMPVSAKMLIKAKLALNYIFAVIPATLIAIASIVVSFSASWVIILENVLLIVLYPLVAGNLGMLFNLLFPNLKWDNINKAVKQGASVLCMVGYSMVLSAGLFLLFFISGWPLEIVLGGLLAVMAILFIVSQILLNKKGEYLLRTRT